MPLKDPWRSPLDTAMGDAVFNGISLSSARSHTQIKDAHTHTPASLETAFGWSISRSVFILPCGGDDGVCVSLDWSKSDDDDDAANEDHTEGFKHMTAILSKQEWGLWFLHGALLLHTLRDDIYCRISSGYPRFAYKWRCLGGKNSVKVINVECGTQTGPSGCVTRLCCQFWRVGKWSVPPWKGWTTQGIWG